MKPTLLRILKNGLLAAAMLALLGYGLSEIGGIFLASQPSGNRSDAELNARATSEMRYRLPIGMAAWGFGLVATFEMLLWLVRGNPTPPAPKPTPVPDQTEQLLNDLLKRAEAQKNAASDGPPDGGSENRR